LWIESELGDKSSSEVYLVSVIERLLVIATNVRVFTKQITLLNMAPDNCRGQTLERRTICRPASALAVMAPLKFGTPNTKTNASSEALSEPKEAAIRSEWVTSNNGVPQTW
jgi:flagellar biogenesis protein FliO